MLNDVTLMGRLTRDPELRYTGSNTPVCSFTLAVERDFKDQGGEKITDFIDCVAWRQTAEFVNKYFSKGSMAIVKGRIQVRDWQADDSSKRRSTEVVASSIYFGESKRRDDGSAPRESTGGYNGYYGSQRSPASSQQRPNQSAGYGYSGGFAELDDDGDDPF